MEGREFLRLAAGGGLIPVGYWFTRMVWSNLLRQLPQKNGHRCVVSYIGGTAYQHLRAEKMAIDK